MVETLRRLWYNRLADWRIVQWLLPHALVMSNREMKPLKEELEHILPLWDKINIPVIMIHGKKDRLVPFDHAKFLKAAVGLSLTLNGVRFDSCASGST